MKLELRVVARSLGLLLVVLSAVIAVVAVFSAYEKWVGRPDESSALVALLATTFVGALLGGLFYLFGKRAGHMLGQREALLLVAASWILGAGLAALPFRIWAGARGDAGATPHDFDTYVNCYFEAMSGLTTTGATIVQAIGTLPRSLLLWRALTHWLGGLGIVVLFVAVLPMLGVGSRRLYRIEAPGPSPEGVRPRIQDTARILWLIYTGLTLVEVVALRLCGMGWFDSTCHTFATLATGGFSTQDASMAAFSSTVQIVVIVFMILAGVNFALYHQLLQRQWHTVHKDPELRAYLAIILVATVIIVGSLLYNGPSAGEPPIATSTTVRDALFQVVSVQTTTGFCSVDFDRWGFVAKATLLTLMFVGASAGSTGGGIKVVRILIAVKVMAAEIEHVYRRQVVRPIKIGRTLIDADLKLNTLVYLVGIGVLFGLGTALIMLFEAGQAVDITTAATASAATLNNIGPGLARVGATQNYAWFTTPSKVVMTVLMLVGRLEMFTIVALFSPRFWREE